MLIEAIAGRFTRVQGLVAQTLTNLGSLRVAQVEADGDEATRAGQRFTLSAHGATGIAPVQALPTTAAQWMIWNPNGNVVSAFFDVLGVELASGTAGAGGVVHWVAVGPSFAPSTVPTISTANVLIKNANPVSAHGSKLICVSAQTLQNTVSSDWAPLAPMNPTGTILGQTIFEQRDLKGKLVIPPGCGIGLAVISPTGTSPLYTPYGIWREYPADME